MAQLSPQYPATHHQAESDTLDEFDFREDDQAAMRIETGELREQFQRRHESLGGSMSLFGCCNPWGDE